MIDLSPVAHSLYGFTQVSKESITNYGYALLAIAGGDNEISAKERQWFDAFFVELLMIPDKIAEQYRNFDFRDADLEKILSRIDLPTPMDTSLLLVYDSIRMSKSDGHFAREERDLILRMGNILKVPRYKIKAIEGVVDYEMAMTDLRKGIFEVDETKTPLKDLPQEGVIRHNSWVKLNFGHTYTSYNSLKSFCELLLVISGADGEVSEAEMTWLELTAFAAGTPAEIIKGLRSFDHQNTTVQELLPNLVTDTYQNLDRICIYLAMHMAAADGEYADSEHQTVLKAAQLLKIESEIVDYLEHVVTVERSADSLRTRLLSA